MIQSVVGSEPVLEALDLLNRSAGCLGIGPEPGLGLLGLEDLQPAGFAGQVKESLEVR
jgi:hypothetical protein